MDEANEARFKRDDLMDDWTNVNDELSKNLN